MRRWLAIALANALACAPESATVTVLALSFRVHRRVVQPQDADPRVIELADPRRDDLELVQEVRRDPLFELPAHGFGPAPGLLRKFVPGDRHVSSPWAGCGINRAPGQIAQ